MRPATQAVEAAQGSDRRQRAPLPSQASPWTPPALTWARRLGHLAAESGHRTASAVWAVGDALLGKNPAFAHNAHTARAHHLARAAHHVDQAQAHGAVVHVGQLKTRGDLGNWLISSAARGLVPAAGVAAAARTYGLPGAAGALYALNTAYYVEDQFHVAGQAHFKEAAIAGLLTTAIQVKAGAALPLAQGLGRPALGATAAAGTSAGQSLNLAHLSVDADTQGASWWQRTVQGAFLATVFGPLFSLRPIPTSASTPPLLAQTHQGLLGSAPRLPGPAPNPTGLPAHSIALPAVSQRNGSSVSWLGIAPSKTYHWPQPHDDARRANAVSHQTPRVSRPIHELWVRGRADSPMDNALQHYEKHRHTLPIPYPDVYAYTDAAHALAQQAMGPGIRRLHTRNGATITIDLQAHLLVVSTHAGKIATLYPTLNEAGDLDALRHWVHTAETNPPVGVRRATDYPLAITALDVQRRLWEAAGLSQDEIARNLLLIRGRIEWGRQLLNGAPDARIRHAVLARKYDDLKQRGHSAQAIIDIALDTSGRHYPWADRSDAPPIDWAATAQYRSGRAHLAAQWISHRYDLTEFKTIYDYSNAAHQLAQTRAAPWIKRYALPDGGRLTLDAKRALLLLETPDGPHSLFRPPDMQALQERLGAAQTMRSTSDVARYAHTLSLLKKQADRSAVALDADLDRVVHTISHQPSAPGPAATAPSS
ncbi:MAG TPA: hypothetical protein PLQ67_04055, partial [Burkholderiaceae bacterium]|nr:hypothetical protein [Burkholderiaceae bacterium]